MIKKVVVGLALVSALGIGGYVVLAQNAAGAAGSDPVNALTAAPPVKTDGKIVSEGRVVPERSSALSLRAGGLVADVLVSEGQSVEEGQVLARLEDSRQKIAVDQAESNLLAAQARLNELKAGPRTQEVDAAKAAVDSAEAQVKRLNQGSRPEDVVAAEARLTAANAALGKVLAGSDRDQIVAAEADLAKLKSGPRAEDVRAAELAVEQAKSNLWGMQTERDGICGNALASGFQCNAANARVSAAEQSVAIAQNNLAKMKAGSLAEDVAAAEARLQKLTSAPSADAIAGARSQVEQAAAAVETVKSPVRAADIEAAQADLRRAQAQLKLVEAGVRPETIAAAQAGVDAAEAALKLAKATLAETELRAPFSGSIVTLDLKPGEVVAAGSPVARLADMSTWQIETTDLTELSAVKVNAGNAATITFDALPGVELSGQVIRVKALGESKRGDIVYTAVVKPNDSDARLRWNMTTQVAIEPTP